uniref:ATP synthase F(1) complex subunit delta, mitochondrial n=1 Tax=Romanomermis culicivorax TaxID=13658 RepID=A0A915L3P3_ROMCU
MVGFKFLRRPDLLAACNKMLSRTYAEIATGAKMPLTFGSPYKSYYNKVDVRQVDVPSFSGHFGILPQHVPTLAVIKPGVLSVVEMDGITKKYFVSSGSISVNIDSSVQILAEEACELTDLDMAACKEGLAEAQREATSATDERAKVEGQIKVEVYEALVKAAETA